MTMPLNSGTATIVIGGIVLSAFISEDGAIFGAAALASSMALNLPSAAMSAFLGLWISDFGVYGAVRLVREKLGVVVSWLWHSAVWYLGHAFLPMFRLACFACLSPPLLLSLDFQRRSGRRSYFPFCTTSPCMPRELAKLW